VKCIGRNPFLTVLCRIAGIPVNRSSDKRDLTVFMRAADSMTYFHNSKLNLVEANVLASGTSVEIRKLVKSFAPKVSVDIWKAHNMLYRRDSVALRTTCIKMSNLRLSKHGQVVRKLLYYSENLNWAAQNLRPELHAAHTWT